MKDPIVVAEGGALQELEHEAVHGLRIEGATFAVGVHVPLEVPVTVLENVNQHAFSVNNIIKSDNVDVFQFLHQRDFADRGLGDPITGLQFNLLESDNLICGVGASLGWHSASVVNGPRRHTLKTAA